MCLKSNKKPELNLFFCSHKAAAYATKHWHYSKSMPTPPLIKIGVSEDGVFIGVVLFSRGANNNLGAPYGLEKNQVCELTRVALANHKSQVSKIVSIALLMLKKHCPDLKLCISYADPREGHLGIIYQAMNWIYTGTSSKSSLFLDSSGSELHGRQVSSSGLKKQYGELRKVPKISDCKRIVVPGKHRYLMPLDKTMKEKIMKLSKPYPKRSPVGGSSNQ